MVNQVAPNEVAAAIRDMLAAAELPLDLERGSLVEQSLMLQQQLREAQAALAAQEQVCTHSCKC